VSSFEVSAVRRLRRRVGQTGKAVNLIGNVADVSKARQRAPTRTREHPSRSTRIYASEQGRDLGSVSSEISRCGRMSRSSWRRKSIQVIGQIQSMNDSLRPGRRPVVAPCSLHAHGGGNYSEFWRSVRGDLGAAGCDAVRLSPLLFVTGRTLMLLP